MNDDTPLPLVAQTATALFTSGKAENPRAAAWLALQLVDACKSVLVEKEIIVAEERAKVLEEIRSEIPEVRAKDRAMRACAAELHEKFGLEIDEIVQLTGVPDHMRVRYATGLTDASKARALIMKVVGREYEKTHGKPSPVEGYKLVCKDDHKRTWSLEQCLDLRARVEVFKNSQKSEHGKANAAKKWGSEKKPLDAAKRSDTGKFRRDKRKTRRSASDDPTRETRPKKKPTVSPAV